MKMQGRIHLKKLLLLCLMKHMDYTIEIKLEIFQLPRHSETQEAQVLNYKLFQDSEFSEDGNQIGK